MVPIAYEFMYFFLEMYVIVFAWVQEERFFFKEGQFFVVKFFIQLTSNKNQPLMHLEEIQLHYECGDFNGKNPFFSYNQK